MSATNEAMSGSAAIATSVRIAPPTADPGPTSRPQSDGAMAVPPAIALWSALVAAHAALDRAVARDHGMCPVVGADVLAILLPLGLTSGGRMRLGDLAERAGLTPSGLTRRIEPLEADGLVQRHRCDSDRRGTWAAITARGLAALPGALEHHATTLDRAIGHGLSAADAAHLTQLLETLART